MPSLGAKIDDKDQKCGLKGSMLSTTTFGAAVPTAASQSGRCSCTVCSPDTWVDTGIVEVVDINYAPRASLYYLGIPFSMLSKPVAYVAAAAAGADDAAAPSALKRAKKAASKDDDVIDLTDD